MAHNFIRHGQVGICDGCRHQCRVTRLISKEGGCKAGHTWLCVDCILEDEAPAGHVVESWCTDCEGTIPQYVSAVYVSAI
jgi:hypothetical protein